MPVIRPIITIICSIFILSCSSSPGGKGSLEVKNGFSRLDIYSPFKLTASMDHLSGKQKQMLGLLIDASIIMDDLFWKVAFGEPKDDFLNRISNEKVRNFARLNYGPWDRLDGNKAFIKGYGPKALGAQFYPADMSKKEFEAANDKSLVDLYSIVSRTKDRKLKAIPYSQAFASEIKRASFLLIKASELAENKAFKKYLKLRAKALVTNSYRPSDMMWMDMKNNPIDVVIGPIETYEDQLFGYRAAFESYVLIKDIKWSKRLARYTKFLPELQRSLPVPKKYKKEKPGAKADLNAYDVIFYAGRSNAGAKTIAINLPNDEKVQLKKGTRRLQLKNIMRAKFEKILQPIAKKLISPAQLKHVTFDAFFANTMFHEVSHGLGIKNTVNGKGLVRKALKEHAGSLEEAKADTLGLYMITKLFEKGEIPKGNVKDNYVTFMAGIFRSVRFGGASAHAKANLICFNFLKKMGAFKKDSKDYYSIDFEKMKLAINELSKEIITTQGNGDYKGLGEWLKKSTIDNDLAASLKAVNASNIPIDIEVIQGKQVLGL